MNQLLSHDSHVMNNATKISDVSSQQKQQHPDICYSLESLPRSVRWRIHLGLLDTSNIPLTSFPVSASVSISGGGGVEESQKRRSSVNHTEKNLQTGGGGSSGSIGDPLLGVNARSMSSFGTPDTNPDESILNTSMHRWHRRESIGSIGSMADLVDDFKQQEEEEEKEKQQKLQQQQLYETIQTKNEEIMIQQRLRYEKLAKDHYWQCSPLAIIDETEKRSTTSKTETSTDCTTNTQYTPFSSASTSSPVATQDTRSLTASTKESLITKERETQSPSARNSDVSLDTSSFAKTSSRVTKNNISIIKDTTNQNSFSAQIKGKTPVVDPLSIMVMLEEEKSEADKKKEIEFRKERVRAARARTGGVGTPKKFPNRTSTASAASNDDVANSSMENNVNSDGDFYQTKNNSVVDSACAGSRWTEFYSSREVLDVIEKDLNRLPSDHLLYFLRRKERKQSGSERHHHQEGSGGDFTEEDDEYCPTVENLINASLIGSKNSSSDLQEGEVLTRNREERGNILSEILFVYAKEHPGLGYRQGMHEVLSLVLMAIEMDLFKQESTKARNKKKDADADNDIIINSKDDLYLLDEGKMKHDAYTLFEAIMSRLAPAYEVKETQTVENSNGGSQSPMELIGKSILKKVRDVAGDERLFQFISGMAVPPEMYCTRWVRLMFSREVVGWKNVMVLWDVFFKSVSNVPSQSTTNVEHSGNVVNGVPTSSTISLMDVLELTAAGMLILIRENLIPSASSMPPVGYDTNYRTDWVAEKDPNDCIDVLMNYPPLDDPSQLIDILMLSISQIEEQRILEQQQPARGLGRMKSWFVEAPGAVRGVIRRKSLSNLSNLSSSFHGMNPSNTNEDWGHDAPISYNGANVPGLATAPSSASQKYSGDDDHQNRPRGVSNASGNLPLPDQPSNLLTDNQSTQHVNLRWPAQNPQGQGGGAWKKMSHTFRGALQSLDHTIQNLAVNHDNSYRDGAMRSFNGIDYNGNQSMVGLEAPIVNGNHKIDGGTSSSQELSGGNAIKLRGDRSSLADRLETSADKLMEFFTREMEKAAAKNRGEIVVPESVWDALTEIQSVQKELRSKKM